VTEHDPEQDAVRRLLGEVPPAGPVPDDVVARLDARLAELVAARESTAPSPLAETGDDELAQARRRRRFRTVLVAAASVSVLGLGLGTVLDDLSSGSGSAESVTAADAEDSGEAGGSGDSGDGSGDSGDGSGDDTLARELEEDPDVSALEEPGAGGPATEAVRPEVRRATLEADVTRIADQESADSTDRERGEARRLAPCAVPDLRPRDRAVPIRFEGEDATLVVRVRAGGAREAEIYACDARGGPLETAALPPR
jgi:hypothetical protein